MLPLLFSPFIVYDYLQSRIRIFGSTDSSLSEVSDSELPHLELKNSTILKKTVSKIMVFPKGLEEKKEEKDKDEFKCCE